MDAATQEVRQRADHCCEYGRVHEADDPLFTPHVEHIVAKQDGGTDSRHRVGQARRWRLAAHAPSGWPDRHAYQGSGTSGLLMDTTT
jgi:hypothetical protein